MKICFFVKTNDPSIFERVGFYAQDIEMLKAMGHEVVIATKWAELPADIDLFYAWWWTYAFLPIIKGKILAKSVITTGVFDHHDLSYTNDYAQRPWYQRMLLRFALKFSNENIFISSHEHKSVSQELGCNNPHYIPLILDTDEYCMPKETLPKENFIFTVSWMAKENTIRKCSKQIIEAFAEILKQKPDTKLIMAGQKHTGYPELETLAKKLGVFEQIEFPGIISKEQKIDYMQRCSVYLQPTLYEGFGLAILEAMSCGAAVVSSPVGAVPEVVADCGVLVDGQQPKAIAEAVLGLLNNKKQAQTIGQEARKRAVQLFSYQRKYKDLKKIIDKYDPLARV